MKKLGFILLSSALLLTACAVRFEKSADTTDSSKVTALSEDKQKMLDKATADYKTFVQEQIDKLLTDTEGFVKLLKEGKLEEAKKVYPLIRMSYERSEPIAESFGESMLTGAVDLLNEVATSKITGEEEIYSHTDLYDFRANIEGAEKIFQLFKPLLEKSDANLVKELEADFKSVNSLLDKHMTDKEHYKLYTDLTKEDTKELSEAVTKLGEPLSQMGKFLSGE